MMKILITPVLAGKPWNGATIYEAALGGSESAVVYLAREFSRMGNQVVVYTHGQPGMFEGVEYRSVNSYTPQVTLEFDAHVSSREPRLLDNSGSNFRVLWLHDMPQIPELSVNATRLVCLSEVQARAWGLMRGEADMHPLLAIEGDGVDLSLFSGSEERNETMFICTSNPDRGLPVSAAIFAKVIVPRWPEATLHIYGRYGVYGWSQGQERVFIPEEKYMGNVVIHEAMPRVRLARELMKAWAMWYPTYWPETFCMAALEAQAAGTPVITSPVGALPETVKGGIVTEDYLNAVSQLRNYHKWGKLSEAGKLYAAEHSWRKVAERWMEGILCE